MEEEEKVEGIQLDHKPKEIFETIVFAFWPSEEMKH